MKIFRFTRSSLMLFAVLAVLHATPAHAGAYFTFGLGHFFPQSEYLDDKYLPINSLDFGFGYLFHPNLAAELDAGIYMLYFKNLYWVGGEWDYNVDMVPFTINLVPQYEAHGVRVYLKAGVGYNCILYDVPIGETESESVTCSQYGGGITFDAGSFSHSHSGPKIECGLEVMSFKSKEKEAKIIENSDETINFNGLRAVAGITIKL
jgi:hypothetical protein